MQKYLDIIPYDIHHEIIKFLEYDKKYTIEETIIGECKRISIRDNFRTILFSAYHCYSFVCHCGKDIDQNKYCDCCKDPKNENPWKYFYVPITNIGDKRIEIYHKYDDEIFKNKIFNIVMFNFEGGEKSTNQYVFYCDESSMTGFIIDSVNLDKILKYFKIDLDSNKINELLFRKNEYASDDTIYWTKAHTL